MKKNCIILLLLLLACKTENKATSETSKTTENPVSLIPEKAIVESSQKEAHPQSLQLGKQVLISSGQTKAVKEIMFRQCKFDAVIDGRSDTVYLATSDPEFITPEKLKVGMKFSQIPVELRDKIQKENGWGYYIPLKSSWNIGFCEGISCTNEDLTDQSEIKWIFKRK